MVGFEPRWGRCQLDGEGTVSAGRQKAQQSGGGRQGRVLGWNSGSFLRADCPMPPRFVPVVQWGTHSPVGLQSWETGSGSACPMTQHEQRWGPSQPPLSPSSKPSSESKLRPGLMGQSPGWPRRLGFMGYKIHPLPLTAPDASIPSLGSGRPP